MNFSFSVLVEEVNNLSFYSSVFFYLLNKYLTSLGIQLSFSVEVYAVVQLSLHGVYSYFGYSSFYYLN